MKENLEGQQKQPSREATFRVNMDKVREAFFKKIVRKSLRERRKVRSDIRRLFLTDPHCIPEDIPFWLNTADQASEELFDDMFDKTFMNFPAEEGREILELFMNKMLKRLCKEKEEGEETKE